MRTSNPTLDDFDNDAALGGRPKTTRRPARTANTTDDHQRSTRPRPTPDSKGPRQPKRAPKKRESYNIVSFFTDTRTHIAVGIILTVIAIVMAVCTISYIFSNPEDQSVLHGRELGEIIDSGDRVSNAGGVLGARIAHLLLVDTFGLASFVLVLYFMRLGLACMDLKKCSFFSITFKSLFATAALSIIFGMFSFNADTLFPLGGNHGLYINHLIYKYTDAIGVIAANVLLLGLLVSVFLYPIKQFFALVSRVMPKPKPKRIVEPEEIKTPEPSPIAVFETPLADDTDELSDATNESATQGETFQEDDSDIDGIPEEHARYMPTAALDDFSMAPAVSEEPENSSKEEIANNVETIAAAEETSIPTEAGEPEMVIINNSIRDEQAQSGTVIRNGDHIGLDTEFDVCAEHSQYVMPSTDLLIDRPKSFEINEEEQAKNKDLIVNALKSYNIEIVRIEATIGPTVTLYEIVPAQGTRIAKIKSLEDDIAMSLSALGIRIIAPIPGKGTIGIEVPNGKPQIVSMRSVLESRKFRENRMNLPMALGATISNEIYMADLTKMPHLLVAGATGQGKSVGLNCIITSLLFSKHPDELKFVLIDPKMVEFSLYQTIDHQYLAKLPEEENAVITDPQKVIATLNSLCVEMDQRYELLRLARVKSLEEYNARFRQRVLNPELGHRFLPYIVMIVDEYADLVMTAGKDISVPICRIAQKARAVGMHMIIATQRPSTDVITGMIKANFTARIAFKVTQSVDSKTILDRTGAQRLIGRGDMLTMMNGTTERVQCALVETSEVEALCQFIGDQSGFTQCYQLPEPPAEESGEVSTADFSVTDEFKRCAMFISTQQQASITMMQRKFEIGFNKAGRFMDQMQQLGIVGPANGAKPRQVLMTPDEVERLFL